MLTSSSHELAMSFDHIVGHTDSALQHPVIRHALGELASQLVALNNAAFLPNKRLGQFRTPREYRGRLGSVAVVPLTDVEIKDSQAIIEPLLVEKGPVHEIADVVSPISGVRVSSQSILDRMMGRTAQEPATTGDGKTNTWAKTLNELELVLYDQTFSASRPVEIIRRDLLVGMDAWHEAGIHAHELAHGLDLLGNPMLHMTLLGHASSELAGYHVGDASFSMSGQSSSVRLKSRQVEELRLQHTDPATPFIPTEGLLAIMQGWIV